MFLLTISRSLTPCGSIQSAIIKGVLFEGSQIRFTGQSCSLLPLLTSHGNSTGAQIPLWLASLLRQTVDHRLLRTEPIPAACVLRLSSLDYRRIIPSGTAGSICVRPVLLRLAEPESCRSKRSKHGTTRSRIIIFPDIWVRGIDSHRPSRYILPLTSSTQSGLFIIFLKARPCFVGHKTMATPFSSPFSIVP